MKDEVDEPLEEESKDGWCDAYVITISGLLPSGHARRPGVSFYFCNPFQEGSLSASGR